MNHILLSWRLSVEYLLCVATITAFSTCHIRNPLRSRIGIYPVCRLAQDGTLSYQSVELQPLMERGKWGVTSAVVLPSNILNPGSRPSNGIHWVLVGTKYGDLSILPFEYNRTWRLSQRYSVNWLPSVAFTNKSLASSSLPIYSLAIVSRGNTTEGQLLAGGADRFISIWKRTKHSSKNHSNVFDWEMAQRLGPHTGWVKSLLHVTWSPKSAVSSTLSGTSHRLYSIGCNRIESWAYNEIGKWTHKSTFAINSSPTFRPSISRYGDEVSVCTLSSDLLCLELCRLTPATHLDSVLFAAGGVDGRIHFFMDVETATEQRIDNIATVIGHQGRVNVLYFDVQSQLLFSGSHDGNVHCWQISFIDGSLKDPKEMLPQKRNVCLVASYDFGADIRVTALSCSNVKTTLDSVKDGVKLLVGTQNGQIHLISLLLSTESNSRRYNFTQLDFLHISDTGRNVIFSETVTGPPTIHTFSRLNNEDSDCLNHRIPQPFVVGHAQGLGLVNVA